MKYGIGSDASSTSISLRENWYGSFKESAPRTVAQPIVIAATVAKRIRAPATKFGGLIEFREFRDGDEILILQNFVSVPKLPKLNQPPNFFQADLWP